MSPSQPWAGGPPLHSVLCGDLEGAGNQSPSHLTLVSPSSWCLSYVLIKSSLSSGAKRIPPPGWLDTPGEDLPRPSAREDTDWWLVTHRLLCEGRKRARPANPRAAQKVSEKSRCCLKEASQAGYRDQPPPLPCPCHSLLAALKAEDRES